MQRNFMLDKEVIYSYDAGEDLYFLKGFEESISIYYREYETSNQVGSIIKEDPDYQSVKFQLKKNAINFNEEKFGIWFSFKPKVLNMKSLQENNKFPALDKIEFGSFAPFNLYWKGRIYRLFYFSSKSEKSVSDRLLFMNYVINSELSSDYFKIDFYGEAKELNEFIKSFGRKIRISKMEIQFDSENELYEGTVKITPGKPDKFDLLTDKGIKSSYGNPEISEFVDSINRTWRIIHKVPLEMTIRKKDDGYSAIFLLEESCISPFLVQIKQSKLRNLRIVEYQTLGN